MRERNAARPTNRKIRIGIGWFIIASWTGFASGAITSLATRGLNPWDISTLAIAPVGISAAWLSFIRRKGKEVL